MPLRHFTEHLVGACLYMKDRPMAIPYNPPIQQMKHETKHELLHKFCKKYHNIAIGSQGPKEMALTRRK